MCLFRLKLVVDATAVEIRYESFIAFLEDRGLKQLFEDSRVAECIIYADELRVAGLPLMDWMRLKDTVISNSTVLLRKAASKRNC